VKLTNQIEEQNAEEGALKKETLIVKLFTWKLLLAVINTNATYVANA
jgi:hypothetical protein